MKHGNSAFFYPAIVISVIKLKSIEERVNEKRTGDSESITVKQKVVTAERGGRGN